MTYEILGVQWRSALHTIGYVAYATGFEDQWNSVVGYRPEIVEVGDQLLRVPAQEEFDAQYIAANGAKLEWELAKILFPALDITKHKYYEK